MSTTPKAEPTTHPDWLVGPDTIPWSEAEQRLTDTRNYWVASTRPDGRPHTRPVWGMWFEGRLVLSAGGGYWMMRNVRAHPEVSVHPEQAEGLVVVVEGVAHEAKDVEWRPRAIEAYDAKYGISYGTHWDYGTIEVLPGRVYAWRVDGTATNGGTRFVF